MTFPTVISLFSGAGGLDLGFHLAGFKVAFAVDISEWAVATHKRNFPNTTSVRADMVEIGAEQVVRLIQSAVPAGTRIGVIGGPPCQGFSRANTNADPKDPRNKLPLLYLDIVSRLQKLYEVEFVLFENVLGIRDRKHEVAFAAILNRFKRLGFSASVGEYSALDFGVPQTRRRVIITAFRTVRIRAAFKPTTAARTQLTVRHAIAAYPEPTYFERSLKPADINFHPNHWTMRPKSPKFSSPDAVVSNARSFKRLAWDLPSPTVAYGHREIHVHPNGHRRLSILEAMTLQGFPRSFVLEGPLSAQVEQVSNAVPPPLAIALATATATALGFGSSHD